VEGKAALAGRRTRTTELPAGLSGDAKRAGFPAIVKNAGSSGSIMKAEAYG